MRQTILIADDSPAELRLFVRALSPLGCRLITAEDGEEAERLARKEHPSLILLDVVMPGKNGFALCRELKQDPLFRDIPIVIASSKEEKSDQLWGRRQGADAYLVKPFSLETLLEVVEGLLAASAPASPES